MSKVRYIQESKQREETKESRQGKFRRFIQVQRNLMIKRMMQRKAQREDCMANHDEGNDSNSI